MKVWSGSAWVEKPTKVWSGSAWVVKPVKVWNGSAWVLRPASAGITVPVFRNNWLSTYTGRPGPVVVDKPAGTIENDIILVSIFHGKNAPAQNDLIPLSGFTKIGVSTIVGDASTFTGKFEMYWKRVGASDPATYSWDVWGSSNNQAYAATYSGCVTSGNPIDVFSQNAHTLIPTNDGKGQTSIGLSVTTKNINDKLLWLGHNWDATGALNPPTGMTERIDHLIYSADETIAVAGATGNRSHLEESSFPWAANLIALKGAGAPASTTPSSSLLVSYAPGSGRNDFTGEVGVRLGVGAAPITVNWIGAMCSAPGGTRTVKLYEWFGDTLERTAVIDMTGKAIGEYAWAAITPITLPANSYYSLLQSVTASDSLTWSNPGPTVFNHMANVHATYRTPGGSMTTSGADQQYVGLDLGF